MARNTRAARLEHTPRPIVAVGNDYPAGHEHAPHQHRRSQLLFAETGTMVVKTAQGSWVVPPHQGIWIPGGVVHGISMLGEVATRSVYLEPGAARGMAAQCRVLGVSPLLRQLLIEAVDLPAEYPRASRAGRLMALLIDEIRGAPALPLSLPFPAERKLAARCRRFVAQPSAQDTIESWCGELGLSRRSFIRRFKSETGLTFAAWQRRACLFAALPRLLQGEAVTTVALDLGYASPASFTTMFKASVGESPSAYLRGKPAHVMRSHSPA
ncbi:MAG TPA: helix-turn-helix transcriptional regulator [Burkholderiales bacterium]|nr:helix-turn-helix transcriptional regulator [Burkholderiales bacterium]